MLWFLDTASIREIETWKAVGLVDGVTTNPRLLREAGPRPLETIREITSIVTGPVSVATTGLSAREIVREAKMLAELAENVVIKIPASYQGLCAAAQLQPLGVQINVTLLFAASQVALFSRCAPAYFSLIYARAADLGLPQPEDAIANARATIDRLSLKTKLLVASIRNGAQLSLAIRSGADVVTVPPTTWHDVANHPLTLSEYGGFQPLCCWAEQEAANGAHDPPVMQGNIQAQQRQDKTPTAELRPCD